MRGLAAATLDPALAAGRTRHTLGVETAAPTPRPQAVTVDAHDEATLVTHPVHVEEGRVTHVTHLTHTLYRSLPRDLGCNINAPLTRTVPETLCLLLTEFIKIIQNYKHRNIVNLQSNNLRNFTSECFVHGNRILKLCNEHHLFILKPC